MIIQLKKTKITDVEEVHTTKKLNTMQRRAEFLKRTKGKVFDQETQTWVEPEEEGYVCCS